MSKAKGDEPELVTSLKVRHSVRDKVNKIAAHRGVSVADFFEQPDVQTFFTHLLIEEMRKETLRLEGEGKPEVKPAGKGK